MLFWAESGRARGRQAGASDRQCANGEREARVLIRQRRRRRRAHEALEQIEVGCFGPRMCAKRREGGTKKFVVCLVLSRQIELQECVCCYATLEYNFEVNATKILSIRKTISNCEATGVLRAASRTGPRRAHMAQQRRRQCPLSPSLRPRG